MEFNNIYDLIQRYFDGKSNKRVSGSFVFFVKELDMYLKIDKKNSLYNEYLGMKFLSDNKLAPKPMRYFSDEKYDYLFIDKVHGIPAIEKFSGDELINFVAKSLRKFHDSSFDNKLSDYEMQKIRRESESILNKLQFNYNNKLFNSYVLDGLGVKVEELENYYNYVKENINDLVKDVIIHEDFNPGNIFYMEDGSFQIIDAGDLSFNDRHIDIICSIIGLELMTKSKVQDKFLDAYGRDAVKEKRLILALNIAPLYYC